MQQTEDERCTSYLDRFCPNRSGNEGQDEVTTSDLTSPLDSPPMQIPGQSPTSFVGVAFLSPAVVEEDGLKGGLVRRLARLQRVTRKAELTVFAV